MLRAGRSRRAVMAPSEAPLLIEAEPLPPGAGVEEINGSPEVQPGIGRNFGFLVHDVSRLIKRRFDRKARQTGLPITRRQAAVILYVSRNEGVSQTEVATWLDMEPIALVRMLD